MIPIDDPTEPKIVTIHPDGTTKTTIVDPKSDDGLRILQHAVGGYIQVVPFTFYDHPDVRRVIVDEDGMQKQLPRNEAASSAINWRAGYPPLGNVVLVVGWDLE